MNMHENPPVEFKELQVLPRSGCVYVVENPLTRQCKIGCSLNPNRRTRAIQTLSGIGFGRIHISPPVSNQRECELAVHDAMNWYRCAGEWFDCLFEDAVAVVNDVVSSIGVVKQETNKILVPERIKDDITEWFLDDSPQLLEWFRKNNLKIIYSRERADAVVVGDSMGEHFEIGFELFARITIQCK